VTFAVAKPVFSSGVSHSESDCINAAIAGAIAVGPQLYRLAIRGDDDVTARSATFIAADFTGLPSSYGAAIVSV